MFRNGRNQINHCCFVCSRLFTISLYSTKTSKCFCSFLSLSRFFEDQTNHVADIFKRKVGLNAKSIYLAVLLEHFSCDPFFHRPVAYVQLKNRVTLTSPTLSCATLKLTSNDQIATEVLKITVFFVVSSAHFSCSLVTCYVRIICHEVMDSLCRIQQNRVHNHITC